MDDRAFTTLRDYLRRVPAVMGEISTGGNDDGMWWAKFWIDIDHPLAWHVVQELGYVLNYISVEERLPTVFMPVSPPPYMNGGPREYLSWVIENTNPDMKPGTVTKWLEGRLPNPVDDLKQWNTEEDEYDEDD